MGKTDTCDKLTLVRDERPDVSRGGHDFAINGRPLSRIIDVADKVGALGWMSSKDDKAFARQLLGRAASALPSGRVPLYICGQCGDLGCQCIAVKVTFHEDYVVWSELSLATNYEDIDVEGRFDARDFYFDAEDYRRELDRFGR